MVKFMFNRIDLVIKRLGKHFLMLHSHDIFSAMRNKSDTNDEVYVPQTFLDGISSVLSVFGKYLGKGQRASKNEHRERVLMP